MNSYSFHNTPIGQELQASNKKCPHCGSSDLKTSPASSPHHSRLDCLSCGRFVRWLPDTSKDEELRRRVEAVDLSRIKGIDHTFIVNLQRQVRISRRDKKRFKLSPKQLRWLSDIEEGVAS